MIDLLPQNPVNSGQSQVCLYGKIGTVSQVQSDQITVTGLIPLGGTSGSPIIDASSGSVVGIESSLFYHYPNGPDKVSNYAGAIITPISLLDDLLRL